MSKFIQSLKSSTVIASIAIFAVVSVSISTTAHAEDNLNKQTNGTSNIPASDETQSQLRSQQRENLEQRRQEMQSAKDAAELRLKARHEARQEKLSASQLEICKNREANINNRIARIADRSAKHLELFNTISERAQAFYTSNGVSFADYDSLVADVATKKTAAETAVASINGTVTDFDCTSDNPKVAVEEFKNSLKTSIDVLKEYRTSVKNLIVGIKTAASSDATDESQPAGETE